MLLGIVVGLSVIAAAVLGFRSSRRKRIQAEAQTFAQHVRNHSEDSENQIVYRFVRD
jgi:hypothetical protein